jgi:hypothetical protein
MNEVSGRRTDHILFRETVMKMKNWLSPLAVAAVAGLAQGAITFQPAVNYNTPLRPTGVAAGDFDGDLDLDLAVATDTPDQIRILINAGNGTFTPGQTIQVGSGPGAVIAADLDGDLDIDLAVAQQNTGQVRVLINNGGTFTLGGSSRSAQTRVG